MRERLYNVLAGAMLLFAIPLYSLVGELATMPSNLAVFAGAMLLLGLIYGLYFAVRRMANIIGRKMVSDTNHNTQNK